MKDWGNFKQKKITKENVNGTGNEENYRRIDNYHSKFNTPISTLLNSTEPNLG